MILLLDYIMKADKVNKIVTMSIEEAIRYVGSELSLCIVDEEECGGYHKERINELEKQLDELMAIN